MRKFMKIGAGAAAMALLIGVVVTIAQDAAAPMDKPLDKFTLGDLFPKVGGDLAGTAAAWKESAGNASQLMATRMTNIQAAIPKVQAAVAQAKSQAKAAEKSKDFAAAGTAQGQMKTQEVVMDVLNRLKSVSMAQDEVAKAWTKAAEAMQKFADADNAFDQYRTKGIAKPEAGQPDNRLDPAGYQAFKQHSQALKDLGAAYSAFGSKLDALGAGRLKFAADLEKGGHIQTPPVK